MSDGETCICPGIFVNLNKNDRDMSKKSIRFYNDRLVRAVWDEQHSKWWFSAVDIVAAINDEDDYRKSRNYWKYLKGKMVKDGIQLVSVTNQFKFEAPDGKQRGSDALDAECVRTLAKHYPANRAKVPFRDPEATVTYHLVCRAERAGALSAVFDALPEIS